jgi:hypothetical protein
LLDAASRASWGRPRAAIIAWQGWQFLPLGPSLLP